MIFDGIDDRLEIWSVPIGGSDSYSCFAAASLDPAGTDSAAKLAILQSTEFDFIHRQCLLRFSSGKGRKHESAANGQELL